MAKISAAQEQLLWEMGHGWQLTRSITRYRAGLPYILKRNGQSKFADKRTVTALLKRGSIRFDRHDGSATTGTLSIRLA